MVAIANIDAIITIIKNPKILKLLQLNYAKKLGRLDL